MKKLVSVLLLLCLTLVGGTYWHRARHQEQIDAVAYTVLPVEFGRLSEVVSATGLVQPREMFVVGAELSGKVVAVLADFNQVVEEGDVLLRLDDRLARARLRQTEIAVEQAKNAVKQTEAAKETAERTVKRLRNMQPEVRPETDLELAEGKLRSALVAVEAAQLKVQEAEEARQQADLALRLTTIRVPTLQPPTGSLASAPMPQRPGTGILSEEATPTRPRRSFLVMDRKVSLNQQIGPPLSAQLFTLAADLDQMQVVAQVGEGDVSKVRRGMSARFTVSGAGECDPAYHGEVDDIRLTPTSEHGAVYYRVVINARNERAPATGDWMLRPGLTASVDVIRRTHEAVWKLPTAALNFQPPPSLETEAARARLHRWQDVKNRNHWQVAWVRGSDRKPWPVFVRTGGRNANGETGIQDDQFTEVLEWDPELRPAPDPRDPEPLQVITGIPAAKKTSLFNLPNVKF
jgi:HlyD family secretion protein